MTELIPFHTHSCYSLLDSLIKIKDYVQWGKNNNMPALALTDHGSLGGSIKFYKECNQNGIKPILGMEAYMTINLEEKVRDNYHLILLAKNKTGWLNLIKLHDKSYYNFYHKPRITFDDLEKYSEGLIACSACLGGLIPKTILEQNTQELDSYIKRFKNIFGDDFYLELQDHKLEQQRPVNQILVQLSQIYNIKLIATNDAHYTNSDDSFSHQVLLCKQTHKKISDTGKMNFGSDEFYLKNTEQMRQSISYLGENIWQQILSSSDEIYNKIEEYDILQKNYNYPTFGKPEESLQKLSLLAQQGFVKRFTGKPININEYINRLKYELETIYKIGFTDYFLVLHDLYKFCDSSNIGTGYGRGCLTYDTPVVTSSGIKKLGEIQIGDKVVTHDGSWQEVYDTHEYDCEERLFQIKTWSSSNFYPTMTNDHKVLVHKNPFKHLITNSQYIKGASSINPKDYFSKDNLVWMRADEIQKGDYVVRPIKNRYFTKIDRIDLAKYTNNKDIIHEDYIEEKIIGNQYQIEHFRKLPRYINIDNDFLYLLGFYIGDGWVHKTETGFACNIDTDKDVVEKICNYFSFVEKIRQSRYKDKKLIQVIVSDRIIAKMFSDIVPKYAENKLIPDFILSQDLDKLQYLLDGLIQSDGSISENRLCYDSININLIQQIRYLTELMGYTTTIHTRKSTGNNHDSYKIRIKNDNSKITYFNDGEYSYIKVKAIDEVENELKKVYDISVANNSNYQTLDFIVHNSGAGSLVLYCLGVTHLDPIEHRLLFERFINPERISAPDVDCDIEDIRRGEVVEYIEKTYGKDKVCNIATYGELTSVSSFKAVASVLEMPFMEANRISKDLLNTNLSLEENLANSEELQKLYKTDSLFSQIIDVAKRLEGGIDKRGVHACGIVISNQPLENLSPVMYVEGADGTMVNCSAFEMKEIDGDLKLLKLDILGLKNLSIVKDAVSRLEDKNFDFKALDFKDKETYKTISKGNTLGVFQLESEIMRKLCRDIQPNCLADLSAINAGARPGSLESGLTESFINRRKGIEEIDYVCNGMEEYLKETLGTFMYQEQVMQLSRVMAGYTMGQADGLRKIIGKKLIDKLPAERQKFICGAVSNGHSEERASEIFGMIEKFGRYGFNASHSYAYSALSYVTAFLKTHYPLQYMTALLNANSDNLDKLNPYIDECYRLGINVLPPDINKSSNNFEHDIECNAIRFGFNGIKGVGANSITPILAERENGEFKSLKDLLNRMPSMNKTVVENLIKCGAINNIEKAPYKFLSALEFSSKAKAKSDYKKGNISYYDCLIRCYIESVLKDTDQYKEMQNKIKSIKGTKKEDKEIKNALKLEIENIILANVQSFNNLQNFKVSVQDIKQNELELLGFPISCNPKKEIIVLSDFIDNTSLADIKNSKDYSTIFSFMGRIKNIKRTRNGSYFAVITDDVEEITTFMKKETYNALEDKLLQSSNYFRIYGSLNKSYDPSKYPDSLKLEGIRYFNTSKDSEIILRTEMSPEILSNVLTKIKESSIINLDDINYRLNIICGDNQKYTTKIDFWISDLRAISDYMIKYGMVAVAS